MLRRQGHLVRALYVPLVLIVAATMAIVVWALVAKATPPAVTQPIAFNHQKHLAAGFTCDLCHLYAAQSGVAGLPRTDVCMACHAAPLTESPEEEKVRAMAQRGHEIPWVQVYRVADHTYFSHRRHVTLGKLDCATCHGDMTRQAAPVTTPAVRFTMDWCMHCHAQRQVSNDCNTCHK